MNETERSMSAKMKEFTTENLYNLEETIAAELFEGAEYPWELLPKISSFIVELGKDRKSVV